MKSSTPAAPRRRSPLPESAPRTATKTKRIQKIMQLPEDDFIALSYLNTKLRDEYCSLEEFCLENDVCMRDICLRMANIGYEYDGDKNTFTRK